MEIRDARLVSDFMGYKQSLNLDQDNPDGVWSDSHGACALQGGRVLEDVLWVQGVHACEGFNTRPGIIFLSVGPLPLLPTTG